jgi:hypothetical protein
VLQLPAMGLGRDLLQPLPGPETGGPYVPLAALIFLPVRDRRIRETVPVEPCPLVVQDFMADGRQNCGICRSGVSSKPINMPAIYYCP